MNICCICLSSNIFKNVEELSLDETKESPEGVVMFCLDIDISQIPHITKKICENCYDSVIKFYEFKTLAQKSFKHLIELSSDNIATNEVSTSGVKIEFYIDENYDDDEIANDDHVNDSLDHDTKNNTAVIAEAFFEDDLRQIIMISEDVKKETTLEEQPDDEWGNNDDIDKPILGKKRKPGRPKKQTNENDTIEEIKRKYIPQECQLCGKFVKNLKQHSIIHSEEHKEKRFKCKTCDKSYVSIVNLEKHEVKHDKTLLENYMKECTLCGKSVRNLNSHIKKVHNQEELKYECSTCFKKFMNEHLLSEHMYFHSGEKRYECDHCKKRFRSKGYCENHIRAVHLNACIKKDNDNEKSKNQHKFAKKILGPKHVCSVCGAHVRNLRGHMEKHKSPDERKKVHCVACNKAYFSRGECKRHFKRRHLNIKKVCPVCNKHVKCLGVHMKVRHNAQSLPIVCTHEGCGKRFISPTALENHKTIHSNIRPFECTQCPSTYKSLDMLNSHIRAVHKNERRFLCQICSKGFFKESNLKSHLVKHTNDRPHECQECGKGCKTIQNLNKHLELHSAINGPNKHVCLQCKKEFDVPADLRTHMLTHTRERKFPCEFCGMMFTRKDHRKTHENRAHFNLKEDKSGVVANTD